MTARSNAHIHRYGVVASTQSIAFDLAEQGAVDGTAVVADVQTEGRGRRGRTWQAEPGTSLLVSIVLRPRLAAERLPLLSFAAALAVAGAVDRLTDIKARLKWPNDVLVNGRKVAGILLESRISDRSTVVVVGIGLNLTQESFPPMLSRTATSVWIESSRRITPDAALPVLLAQLDAWRTRLEAEGFAPLRARWLELADTIGRQIRVGDVTGAAIDLGMDGALLVDADGSFHRVIAGDVIESNKAAGTEPVVHRSKDRRDVARR